MRWRYKVSYIFLGLAEHVYATSANLTTLVTCRKEMSRKFLFLASIASSQIQHDTPSFLGLGLREISVNLQLYQTLLLLYAIYALDHYQDTIRSKRSILIIILVTLYVRLVFSFHYHTVLFSHSNQDLFFSISIMAELILIYHFFLFSSA